MVVIDWMGIDGFLFALGAFIAIIVPSGLSVATFVRTGRLSKHQQILSESVQKIETATNGIKDALVKSTRETALLEGAATEHAAQKARDALRAEGVASVTPTEKP